jgi:pyruvate dehydrogenase (quinone)
MSRQCCNRMISFYQDFMPLPQSCDVGTACDVRRPEVRRFAAPPRFPYARYAELLGLRGVRVATPDQVGPGGDQALASDTPVVVEAVTDPEVPPLPPHITLDQAKALSAAVIGGDPNAGRIVR